MVVLGLAVNTVYALANFMGAFTMSSQNSNVGQRFVWTYLPILLATAIVVFVLLKAFVFRTAVVVADGEPKPKMSERQKALALGYAVPILCTAFAIIFGLFVYDATRTNLDVWIWVLIISAYTSASGTPVPVEAGVDGAGLLRQGYLEESSVDSVREVTELIKAQRGYELNSKVLTAADQMLSATVQVR